MHPELDTIGKRIQYLRDRFIWTQKDLAKASGLTQVTISRIENDRFDERPRQSTLHKLAKALQADPSWIAFGGDLSEVEGYSVGKLAA
jgi:transcriptional regulator with XRE-family HTH domain